MSSLTAVLLAGGRGTRIQDIYPDIPKPMIPVHGEPFLHWITSYLANKGIRDFVYSTGYLAEQIEAWCFRPALPGLMRRTCRELNPLGTGGGLINCLPLCGEWILAGNGDCLCLGGLGEIVKLADTTGIDGAVLGVYSSDTSRYGSLGIAENGLLKEFREKQPGSGYINAGFYLFRKDILTEFPTNEKLSIETDLFPSMLAGGRQFKVVQVPQAPFIDIGTPETITLIEDFIQKHRSEFTVQTD